jgi:eukaryotic-like serine/threonine-protein kinase
LRRIAVGTALAYLDTKQSSYTAFRNLVAERTRRILPWVGAGLSTPAGLPTWNDLRRLLCDELVERARQQDEATQKKYLSEADLARKHQNAWVAFEILKRSLGETTYRDTIRTALGKADGLEPPQAYGSLWKLKPAGILSLNLDLFVTRAYTALYGSRSITTFHGQEAPASRTS